VGLAPARDRLSHLARDVAGQSDSAAAIARAVDLAATILPCDIADLVRLRTPRSPVLVASTDPVGSRQAIDLADEAKSGMSWTRLTAGVPAVLSASRVRSSQPADPETAVVPAQLVIAVTLAGTERHFLRFLATDSTLWTEDHLNLATAYADLAAMAIDLVALRSRTEHLTRALDSNRQIGTAIGILMAARRVDQEGAFELLRESSQRRNQKLWEVAREVVTGAGMPPADPTETVRPSTDWGAPAARADRGTDERSRVL